MSRTLTPGNTGFGAPWAGFTAVVWLSSGTGTMAQQDAFNQAAAQGQPGVAKRITLATVLVRATSR
jgi:hypothetical protein